MTGKPRPIEIVVCVSPSSDDARPHAPWRFLSELELRAVEIARLLGEWDGVHTTAVSVGPAAPAVQVLTECLARGIDRAMQVGDDWVEDSLGVAACLAEALGPVAPELIICAQRSGTGAHGVVPAALADRLGLPVVSNVIALDVDWAQRQASATQMLEHGARWTWGSALPMVCAVERDVAEPRYLAVRRFTRARASGGVAAVRPNTADALAAIEHTFGAHTIESVRPARIRPKKAKAPPKQMSAADRMKFLRGGGQDPLTSGGDGPRRFAGSPEDAAREILALLEKEELI
jgi:electron transfer flavoprotein alpha/beta subunit